MLESLLTVMWLCLCVFVLVLCVVAAFRKDPNSSEASPLKSYLKALSAGLSLFVLAQPFLIYPDVFTGDNEVLAQVLNLSLAVIGLVITTSTGIAVATSWRALDNAKDADAHATEALSEYRQIKGDLERRILTQSAYLEALNARFQYMNSPESLEFRVAQGYCDALIAPNEVTKVRTIEAINDVSDYAFVAEKIFRFKHQENFLNRYFATIADDANIARSSRQKFSQLIA